jgi:cell wall assembly regulator SMI1
VTIDPGMHEPGWNQPRAAVLLLLVWNTRMNHCSIVRVMDELCEVLQGQPGSIFELESGTSVRDILSVEQILGLALPPPLGELLEVYNGQRRQLASGAKCDMLLPSLRMGNGPASDGSGYGYFCGIEQMLLETLCFREELDRVIQDGTTLSEYNSSFTTVGPAVISQSMLVISNVWNPRMVCIDLAPESPDRYGQVVAISEQPNVAAVIAPSIGDYFASILNLHKTSQLVASTVDGIRTWHERGIKD